MNEEQMDLNEQMDLIRSLIMDLRRMRDKQRTIVVKVQEMIVECNHMEVRLLDVEEAMAKERYG